MAYICICNPTTDKQIIDKIKTSKSLDQVKQELQICNRCKSCSKELECIYNKFKT